MIRIRLTDFLIRPRAGTNSIDSRSSRRRSHHTARDSRPSATSTTRSVPSGRQWYSLTNLTSAQGDFSPAIMQRSSSSLTMIEARVREDVNDAHSMATKSLDEQPAHPFIHYAADPLLCSVHKKEGKEYTHPKPNEIRDKKKGIL